MEVDRLEADSGDTYGCQPNPGVAVEVKDHVIKEGNLRTQTPYLDSELTNRFRKYAHCAKLKL